MRIEAPIPIRYRALGICGLSCRLCPRYQSTAASRCEGCKTASRLGAACSIQTCALKKQRVEYCGACSQSESCRKWAEHREAGRRHDSFVSYLQLEENILQIQQMGLSKWNRLQLQKERLLKKLLEEYNEGRSGSYLCLAATLLPLDDLKTTMAEERRNRHAQSDTKTRSKAIHSILDRIAERRNTKLVLRK